MNCQEVQSLITEYSNGILDTHKLEPFLAHISSCEECREELEVYYIVITGIKRMDHDENIAINYHQEFLNSLVLNQNRINRAHFRMWRRRIMLGVIVFLVMYIANFSLSKEEITNNITYRIEGESEYRLGFYFFEGKDSRLDVYVDRYLKERANIVPPVVMIPPKPVETNEPNR